MQRVDLDAGTMRWWRERRVRLVPCAATAGAKCTSRQLVDRMVTAPAVAAQGAKTAGTRTSSGLMRLVAVLMDKWRPMSSRSSRASATAAGSSLPCKKKKEKGRGGKGDRDGRSSNRFWVCLAMSTMFRVPEPPLLRNCGLLDLRRGGCRACSGNDRGGCSLTLLGGDRCHP